MSGEQRLWQEVLYSTICDAVKGVPAYAVMRVENRIAAIYSARKYLTDGNRDFITICHLAGMEPDAVMEKVRLLIEAAPAPEELVTGVAPAKIEAPAKAPKKRGMTYTAHGKSLTLREWEALTGIPAGKLYRRIEVQAWDVERALAKL